MASADERLDEWLRDAHAMEEQAERMLETQARRIENYPEMKTEVERHLQETRRHAEMLQRCIERRGTTTSAIKDATGKFTAMMQGLAGMFTSDEVVKNCMAGYTFEHFEISAYRILVAAAEHANDPETQQVCETILREEEAMADYLHESLPSITQEYLAREEADLAEAQR